MEMRKKTIRSGRLRVQKACVDGFYMKRSAGMHMQTLCRERLVQGNHMSGTV